MVRAKFVVTRNVDGRVEMGTVYDPLLDENAANVKSTPAGKIEMSVNESAALALGLNKTFYVDFTEAF